jgi:predicted ATPase with chaperone activity
MNAVERQYESMCYLAGKVDGRAEMILALLVERFGPQSEAIQARVHYACTRQEFRNQRELDRFVDSLLKGEALEQVLSSLSLQPFADPCQ